MSDIGVPIVPDTGPAAMAAGLLRTLRQTRAQGLDVVAVEVCHATYAEMNFRLSFSAEPRDVHGVRIRFTCDTPSGRPCTCERAKAPAVAVRAEVPVDVVGSTFRDAPDGATVRFAYHLGKHYGMSPAEVLARLGEAPTFHTGGVVTDASPVPEPPCAVVPYVERQQRAAAWVALQPQSTEGSPVPSCDWAKVLEQARRNPVPMPGGPGEPLTVVQPGEVALTEHGLQVSSALWKRAMAELGRRVTERPLRLVPEEEVEQMRELLRQATQLVGDGEGGELQRQWLTEARRVLEVEG